MVITVYPPIPRGITELIILYTTQVSHFLLMLRMAIIVYLLIRRLLTKVIISTLIMPVWTKPGQI